jgi:hypothetical protein
MSVNAARRSACATMISIFYEASAKLSGIALAMLDPIRALHPAIQAQIDGHPSIGILNARRAQRRSLLFGHNLQR